MFKRMMVLFCMVLSAIILFALPVTSKAEVRGVTDTEILIGSTMDLSGPVAFFGKTISEAAETYFKYVNDKGGIHGRKIRWLVEDDGYQSPRTVGAAKKLILKDKVFCMHMNIGAAGIHAMAPLLDQYKVPLFVIATSDDNLLVPPRKYIFGRDSGYIPQGFLSVKYTAAVMKEKISKAAIIFQDDAPGHQYSKGLRKGFEKYGIKDWVELSYKRGSVDFSSQMSVCKANGITHVFMFTNVREPAAILKEAQRINYKALFFTSSSSAWGKVLELAGDSVDFSKGFYCVSNDNGDQNNKAYWDMAKKTNLRNPHEFLTKAAVSGAMIMEEILRRAGRDLTVESAIKAAETFKNYDNGLMVPTTWGPDRRDGGRSNMVFKAEKGKWVRVTDKWLEMD